MDLDLTAEQQLVRDTVREFAVDKVAPVAEGPGEADTTISTSEDNFLAITRGELNPTSAYMTGKLKIKGDMGAAMKLQKLF